MIETDNIDVKLPQPRANHYGNREARIHLKQLEAWLRKHDIKYSIVYFPVWAHYPVAINMRKEDALMFKIVHNL